ncbi:aspartic peptidase domain-containing protein [Usnea florida]
MHSLLPLLTLGIAILSTSSDATTPLVIPWNKTNSYGPDGPWSVVTVQVGSSSDTAGTQPLSTVDLHPGGIWQSMILRKSFCNDNGTVFADGSSECLAEKAGLYYVIGSTSAQQGISKVPGLVWQWGSCYVDNVGGSAVNLLDTMTIPTQQGAFTVYNSTISAVRAWQIQLPDGTWYSAQVGTLSLGAPGTGVEMYNATEIGQTVPGFAYNKGATGSNSWGLHYGSASLSQEGSLVFGGYDQSRILGNMGIYDLAENTHAMVANMLDVQIGVEIGSSPFSETSYTGLLKLNATFKGVQPAVINPIVPYMFMSPETCAAVAENLPLSFDSQVGLYMWNTSDSRYEKIIKSSAYLALVFQNSESGNLTIKVPFQLLNLTLEAPIVNETQQYFPCRPFYASDGSGYYFLGKAFLQAAFIGMNWQLEKFFVAQAPGPGVGASNIQPIGANDIPITTDPIENFASTWAKNWPVLSDTNDTNPGSGLASRTKTGIAVGAVVASFVVAGGILLCCSRKRKRAVPQRGKDVSQELDTTFYEKGGTTLYEKDGWSRAIEVGIALSHEADASNQVYEIGVSR